MPPLAAGTTLSRLCPPLSVRRSDGPKFGRLASATGFAVGRRRVGLDVGVDVVECRLPGHKEHAAKSVESPARAGVAPSPRHPHRLPTDTAPAHWPSRSLDSSCRANAGARPLTRSARSASRSVTITSTAIQLAAVSASQNDQRDHQNDASTHRYERNRACLHISLPCTARPWLYASSFCLGFNASTP